MSFTGLRVSLSLFKFRPMEEFWGVKFFGVDLGHELHVR